MRSFHTWVSFNMPRMFMADPEITVSQVLSAFHVTLRTFSCERPSLLLASCPLLLLLFAAGATAS